MYERKTPVLFLIFNRPDKTQEVFKKIREAKPERLFIAADGPREHVPDDLKNCEETRKVVEQVDWDCEVTKLFREKNSGGSGKAVSSAVNWFFEQVEEGIILEDDCLPNQSFFYFCQEMLKKYRLDDRIMHVSGSNFQFGRFRGDGTYYFSKMVNVWGWATWRRAWKHFDYHMSSYPESVKQNILHNIFCSKKIQTHYKRTFGNAYHGIWSFWDRRWMFAVFINNGLSIIPNKNLISNIGFGNSASAEYYEDDKFINTPTEDITEVVHPTFMIPDRKADEYHHLKVFTHPPLPKRIKRKLRKILRSV